MQNNSLTISYIIQNTRIVSIMFAIVFAWQAISCSDPIPFTKRYYSKEDLPTVSIDNLISTYTENGRVNVRLQAEIAERFDGIVEPYIDFKKGLSLIIYDKFGKIETTMTADKVIYYDLKKTWEATGNVTISNIRGDVLKTQKLYGDDKERKIFTDKYVKITKNDGTVIYGKTGFESNTDFTVYQFKDVSGRIFFREGNSSDDSLAVGNTTPSN
jgi:LPS export ABC transporter protein LptC